MRSLYILALSIALAGCTWFKPKTDAIVPPKAVHIDPRALVSCQDLVIPEVLNFDSLLTSSVANAELYLDCRNKQENSIKLLKEFSNSGGKQ